MSTKTTMAEMETVSGANAESVAGDVVPLGTLNEESSLEGPPSINTGDFEWDVGEVVELMPPDAASPFERIIEESDLLPVGFLSRGVEIQRAVGRVVLTKSHGRLFAGSGWGTGFMVSDSFFMTNNHVVQNLAFFEKFRVQFNFQLDQNGIEETTESFFPDANGVFHTNKALDYSLIRLQPNHELADANGGSNLAGKRWASIQLNPQPIFHQDQHFNIIQHPSGRHKEVSLQDNGISELRMNAVRYTSDTEPGSSGSPVFNNMWELVALHHAGGAKDENNTWINNQGIRLDRIVADLRNHFGDQPGVLTELRI